MQTLVPWLRFVIDKISGRDDTIIILNTLSLNKLDERKVAAEILGLYVCR